MDSPIMIWGLLFRRLRMENCHVIFRCGSFESGTAVTNDHGRLGGSISSRWVS